MKQKKLLFSLFALFTSMTAWGQDVITGLTYNAGGYYEINDGQDLKDLATYVTNGHTASGMTFKMTDNIDMSDITDYSPIGTNSYFFCGHFDGQGFAISNLTISGRAGSIFGCCGSGCIIEKVVLSNSTFTGNSYSGGIVSHNNGGTVCNCYVTNTVKLLIIANYEEHFGGIVAHNDGGTVSGCISAADIIYGEGVSGSSSSRNMGGIVGNNGGGGIVKDCLYLGTTIQAYSAYGAIVGGNYGESATVQNCYFTNSSAAGGNAIGSNSGTVTNTGLARTITLGEKVWLNPTSSATYSCANLIGYTFEGGYALDYGSTLYSTGGATIALRSDENPGYTFNSFSYNDGSDHDIVGNSFTMPAANVSVSALWTENVLELVNDEDNSSALSTAFAGGKTYNRVILNGRSLTKNGNWNTLCLPFSMTAEEIATSPLAGAIIKEMDEESRYTLGDYTLTLKFKTASSIEAGKPYIVKWADGSGTVGNPLTFNLVTITSATPQTVTTNDEGKQLNFVGTYGPVGLTKNVTANLYMGSDSQLYYPNVDGFYVNAFRAYFKLGKLGGGVKAIVMDFGEDDPDAIRNSQFTIHNEEAEWYDLGGRKLSGKPTQHGIYIHNGRKEVLK